MPRKHVYSPEQALKDLGGKPSEDEIQRLIQYFPKYTRVHRMYLLRALLEGTSQSQLVDGTIKSKGLDPGMSGQARGGRGRSVMFKLRRAVIRTLYLRLRVDEQKTHRQANQALLKYFFHSGEKDNIQSVIRKATHTPHLP